MQIVDIGKCKTILNNISSISSLLKYHILTMNKHFTMEPKEFKQEVTTHIIHITKCTKKILKKFLHQLKFEC